MRILSGLILSVAAILLGACDNYVHSSRPWFTEDDALQAPAVRSGWWTTDDPDCRFSAEAPSAAWPACVAPVLLPPGDRFVLRGAGGEAFLVPGKPPILQMLTAGDDTAEPPTVGEYVYYGLQPRRRDARGRITAFDIWVVLCGRPSPPTSEHPFGERTRKPWPGLVVQEEDAGCTARDVEALRNAARRSKRFKELPDSHLKWVRDWRPGDTTWEQWLAASAGGSH